jgi:hypothetical protein
MGFTAYEAYLAKTVIFIYIKKSDYTPHTKVGFVLQAKGEGDKCRPSTSCVPGTLRCSEHINIAIACDL